MIDCYRLQLLANVLINLIIIIVVAATACMFRKLHLYLNEVIILLLCLPLGEFFIFRRSLQIIKRLMWSDIVF
jgi:hypothetical protein